MAHCSFLLSFPSPVTGSHYHPPPRYGGPGPPPPRVTGTYTSIRSPLVLFSLSSFPFLPQSFKGRFFVPPSLDGVDCPSCNSGPDLHPHHPLAFPIGVFCACFFVQLGRPFSWATIFPYPSGSPFPGVFRPIFLVFGCFHFATKIFFFSFPSSLGRHP